MADYYIVGSYIMRAYGFDIDPKDVDIFYRQGTQKPDVKKWYDTVKRIEYHAIPSHIFDKFILSGFGHGTYIDLESLYILKLSHAEYDIHWSKTVNHIQRIKRKLMHKYGSVDIFKSLPSKYHDLFYALKDFWKEKHKEKKKIRLAVTKKQFFNEKVSRKYDHDFLHEVVKYNDEPMYKKCLKDGHEVLLDENKFKKLSKREKLQLCREEIYVIALERFLIPSNFAYCEHECYRAALKKLVTTMTKGWFPTFIVDNYDLLSKIDKNYMKIFLERTAHHGKNV